jgi:hypothetical protein
MAAKVLKIDDRRNLVIENGIAIVTDTVTGQQHSSFSSIHPTGSVTGMKKLGYWGKKDVIVKAHGWIYNVSRPQVCSNEWEKIAEDNSTAKG